MSTHSWLIVSCWMNEWTNQSMIQFPPSRVCIILNNCWWECKLVQPLWKTVWRFLKKLKIQLPYEPVIPLLGIYPDKSIVQKDTSTPMFTSTVFTIAKTEKQTKDPLTDEYICVYIYYIYTHTHNEILLSHQKEWNNAICSNMDRPRNYTKWQWKTNMIKLTCGL